MATTRHNEKHPLSGEKVVLGKRAADPNRGVVVPGTVFYVEDWWDRVYGDSWMNANGNFAALNYAVRVATNGLPLNDEVVYGKDDYGLGHLVHVSELGD